jgi:integrase
MAKVELSDRFAATAKAGDFFDSRTPGLQLRATPKGVKTWFYVFTSPKTSKRSRLTIGRYPSTTLARARTIAIEHRGDVERGVDPRDVGGHADAGDMTVGHLIEEYCSKRLPALRTGKRIARDLQRDVLPVIGNVKLAGLHRRDAHRVLDLIIERGSPLSARRCLHEMLAAISWGVERGFLDLNPFQSVTAPPASKPRERSLSDEEIAVWWREVPNVYPEQVALALKLMLATGQRSGEIAGLRWSELDLPKRIWKLPPERTKNACAHEVPLSDVAIELIEEARPGAGDRVFPGLDAGVSRIVALERSRIGLPTWRSHDLRRTFCSKLAELGTSPLVIGHLVNHRTTTRAGQTLATYVTYSFAAEKKSAMQFWADRLKAIIAGDAAKVLPMRGKR